MIRFTARFGMRAPTGSSQFTSQGPESILKPSVNSRECGGTGRRAGFKPRCRSRREGSTPSTPTFRACPCGFIGSGVGQGHGELHLGLVPEPFYVGPEDGHGAGAFRVLREGCTASRMRQNCPWTPWRVPPAPRGGRGAPPSAFSRSRCPGLKPCQTTCWRCR